MHAAGVEKRATRPSDCDHVGGDQIEPETGCLLAEYVWVAAAAEQVLDELAAGRLLAPHDLTQACLIAVGQRGGGIVRCVKQPLADLRYHGNGGIGGSVDQVVPQTPQRTQVEVEDRSERYALPGGSFPRVAAGDKVDFSFVEGKDGGYRLTRIAPLAPAPAGPGAKK